MTESTYSYAELSEMANSKEIGIDILEQAGLLSERLINYFLTLKEVRNVDNVKELDEWDRQGKKHVNKKIRLAVKNGRTREVATALGLTGRDNTSIPDWKQYERIKDLFRKDPIHSDFTNKVFAGFVFSSAVTKTGRGKSDFVYSLSEMARTVHPNIKRYSNVESDSFDNLPKNWYEIREIIREEDGHKFIKIDDASPFLQYADQKEGVMLSEELVFLRKNNCHLVIVVHTGRDIPANVRRHMFAIDKQSEKKAIIGSETRKKQQTEAIEIANELLTVEDIPQTEIDYNSDTDGGYTIKFDSEDSEGKGEDDSESEQIEFARCQKEECGKHTENSSRKEGENIIDIGYCFDHMPEFNECRENSCNRKIALNNEGYCKDHE